mgnify:CR=1 FL=1
MHLLHHIDVVKSGRSRAAPADVLKAAGHVFLPVEIVGRVARRAERGLRTGQHLRHIVRRGKLHPPGIEVRALFEGQRVDGHVLRGQRQHLPQRIGKRRGVIAGQARDKVHIHSVIARCARRLIGGHGLRRSVAAADPRKDGVVHGLGG